MLSDTKAHQARPRGGGRPYKRSREGPFPRPVPLGGRAVAWVEAEVSEWTDARVAERDRGAVTARLTVY
jgi:prophage regulatory protein